MMRSEGIQSRPTTLCHLPALDGHNSEAKYVEVAIYPIHHCSSYRYLKVGRLAFSSPSHVFMYLRLWHSIDSIGIHTDMDHMDVIILSSQAL